MIRIVRVWLYRVRTEVAKAAFWNNLLKRQMELDTLSLRSVWQLLMPNYISRVIMANLR